MHDVGDLRFALPRYLLQPSTNNTHAQKQTLTPFVTPLLSRISGGNANVIVELVQLRTSHRKIRLRTRPRAYLGNNINHCAYYRTKCLELVLFEGRMKNFTIAVGNDSAETDI